MVEDKRNDYLTSELEYNPETGKFETILSPSIEQCSSEMTEMCSVDSEITEMVRAEPPTEIDLQAEMSTDMWMSSFTI